MAEPACEANTGDGDPRTGAKVRGARRAGSAPVPGIDVRPEGDRVVVAMSGELDFDAAERLEHALRAALDAAVRGVDLELGAVEFCDCSTLNVLLDAREQALSRRKTLTLRSAGPAVARLMSLTGTRVLFDAPGPDGDRDRDREGATAPRADSR
ncbi:STAS domain-containing protein [Streptomyces sp. NPDC051445]|uniref:STAS domain-containing protein n=1 Tax=unclassified Streptomyces TaxID=2593676 RepID=UPI0037BC22BF